ncbi:hypothetical protein [Solemya velum gill symbiont]|uniref:hypothetical protein n=1 Tax=Solemya velum gill symbiont TaxID=2340 RepID=UPI0018A80E5C|nr:hypothetical protein [Solemya velum gill symbiont]
MKQIDYLRKRLQKAITERGEDAPSVKELKCQIAAMEQSDGKSAKETFHLMGR